MTTATLELPTPVKSNHNAEYFKFNNSYYDFLEFYDIFTKNIWRCLKRIVGDQDASGYQILGINPTTFRETDKLDSDLIKRGGYPQIELELDMYLPAEKNRLTFMRLSYGNEVSYSLPFPHRYFRIYINITFHSAYVYLRLYCNGVTYAYTVAHRKKTSKSYKSSFIGAWLPNHDGSYYCSAHDFTSTLRTVDQVFDPDVIRNILDDFFGHYLNSIYNQDLMPSGISSPAAAYICQSFDIISALKKKINADANLSTKNKDSIMLNVDAFEATIKKLRQTTWNFTEDNYYAGYNFSFFLIYVMAEYLQDHQDFWDNIKYRKAFDLAKWSNGCYHPRAHFKSRIELNAMINKKLAAKGK
jgi:hypothetical protein